MAIKRWLILAGLILVVAVGVPAKKTGDVGQETEDAGRETGDKRQKAGNQTGPRTVREFFMALPGRYFGIECCGEKGPVKAKERYLEQYLTVEDTANGYMSAGGDAAQDAFVMALFKRADGSYLIGLFTYGEGGVEDTPWTVFLDYRGGKFKDVSRSVVPRYNKAKFVYELPRNGTTVEVFAKDEMNDLNKGKKLHDLVWKAGKFEVRR
jgi:hypothetical protein